jgi:hypothetical protein
MKDHHPSISRGLKYMHHFLHSCLGMLYVAAHLCEIPVRVAKVFLEVDEQKGDLVRAAGAIVRPAIVMRVRVTLCFPKVARKTM